MTFLRSELNFNYSVTAFHFSCFSLGILISGLLGAKIINYCGRKNILWSSFSGVGAGLITLVLGQNAAVTMAGIGIAGVCVSLFGQIIDTVLAEQFGEQRAIAISETGIATSICAMIAPGAIAMFTEFGMNWRMPILSLIVLMALSYKAFGYTAIPESPRIQEQRNLSHENLRTTFWVYWLVCLLTSASEWSIIFWSADFLEKTAILNKSTASAALSAFFIAMLLGRICGSRLLQNWTVGQILARASTCSLIGFLIFWLAPNLALKILGLFLTGLSLANVYPLTLSKALGAAAGKVGLATSRINIATGTAGLCTPLVFGAIADHYGVHFAFGSVAMLLIFILAALTYAKGIEANSRRAAAIV